MKFRIVFWEVLPCKIIVDRLIALMMEAARTSGTSVDNYFTRQYLPEDNSNMNYLFSSCSSVNFVPRAKRVFSAHVRTYTFTTSTVQKRTDMHSSSETKFLLEFVSTLSCTAFRNIAFCFT
jgi:hypothetical protein